MTALPALSANLLGLLAMCFWSMNVAVTRHLGEGHALGLPGLSIFLAGAVLIGFDILRRHPPPWKADADPRFWLWGGLAFVVSFLCYIAGVAFASDRVVVLPLGMINYFWPWIILLLMPLFFPQRVAWPALALGIVLCVAGVGLALLWGLSWRAVMEVCRHNLASVVAMCLAAFLWAFYCNASRKWGGTANGTGWFLLATGIALLAAWRVSGDPLGYNPAMLEPLLVHALLVNAAAYLFWDAGVRRGSIKLLGILANFLPIGSVLFGVWYLGDAPTPGLFLGCVLVSLGALCCRHGVKE